MWLSSYSLKGQISKGQSKNEEKKGGQCTQGTNTKLVEGEGVHPPLQSPSTSVQGSQ